MVLHRPAARALSPFVSVLWHAEAWKPPHRRERRMPDGCASLIISLDPHAPFAVVSGPSSQSFVLDTAAASDTIMGAQFTAGGAAAFLEPPVSEVRNTSASMVDVADRSTGFLAQQLVELTSPEARLLCVERWLAGRLQQRGSPDRSVLWAARQLRHAHTRIADVSGQIGHSSRWFINRFAADVGLTPKVFQRVQRFQAALRMAHRSTTVNLADLALAAGYFDQAHLTHEFNAIAGMTPSAVLAGRTSAINHVVDVDSP